MGNEVDNGRADRMVTVLMLLRNFGVTVFRWSGAETRDLGAGQSGSISEGCSMLDSSPAPQGKLQASL